MSLTFNRKIIIWVIIKGRFTDSFNNDWKFLKLTQKDGLSELEAEKPYFNDSNWESVTLPHTWNAVDGCDGWSGIDEGGEHYYRGIGGYRKSYFFDSDRFADKEIFLEFEGANTVTELYVNGARPQEFTRAAIPHSVLTSPNMLNWTRKTLSLSR